MKVTFEDSSFIEIKHSDVSDKVSITISAKDHVNPLKRITNACDVSMDDFKKMVKEVLGT